MTPQQCDLLDKWRREVQIYYRANFNTAKRLADRNLCLGIPSVILSAIVGTSVFATLQENPSATFKISVGIVSVSVAVLASLQTFMRFSERAESHRQIASKFSALHRQLREYLANPAQDDNKVSEWMASFRNEWDRTAENSPMTYSSDWKAAKRRDREEEQRGQS